MVLALLVTILLVVAVRRLHQTPPPPAAPQPTPAAVATVPAATPTAEASPAAGVDTTPIAARVAALTAPLQGTYGVWVYDLPTGASFGQHEHQSFIAASVIKAFILTALYEQVGAGKVSLDDHVTTTAADIQNFGTGSIRYDPVGTTYTLAELARRAAKQSDNTAAYLIQERLGQQFIQDRVSAWGFSDTAIADDRTTPGDAGMLFAHIARRQLLPPRQAVDLLGLLSDTDFEDRLPALLPTYVVVAHKIGTEANGVMNDVGVVTLPTRSYVIAVMTAGADPDQAIAAEQQISEAVFSYEAALP